MSKLSREDILKLASLSQLELSDQELTDFTADLNAILTYVETLQSVDTKNLTPTYQVTGLTNVFREDIIDAGIAGIGRKELMKNAPDQQMGQFKVKRVIG